MRETMIAESAHQETITARECGAAGRENDLPRSQSGAKQGIASATANCWEIEEGRAL
jgi:hypothetical protein